MNADLMTQYIQFVADRLSVQLGYDKIYNVINPFDWMELISLDSKTNFFEKKTDAYALANKTITEDIFDLTEDF
jgi:ribonucleotide reductase beta subunit family protein with ferritin-like domain